MNKLDWKSYEELVRDIYESLGKASNVKILGYGNGCKQKGNSGVEHQIDVLTSHNDGLHDYLTDVECKYWKQKVDKDIVMKVKEIVADCNFSKGIIVSKVGFTPDAIDYARFVGIGLVELREITEEDWKGRVKTIDIEIVAKTPVLTSCQINVISDDPKVQTRETKGVTANATLTEICKPDGSTITLSEFIQNGLFKKICDEEPTDEIIEHYSFEKGTIITYKETGVTHKLNSIILSGKVKTESMNSVIDGSDEVLYYMKSIFEGMVLTIRKDGRIVKQNN